MSTIHPPRAVTGVWTEMKASFAFILSYVFLRFLFRRTVCGTKRVVTFRSIKSRVKFVVNFILFILPILWQSSESAPSRNNLSKIREIYLSHRWTLAQNQPALLTSSLSGILICHVWRQTSKLGLDGRGTICGLKIFTENATLVMSRYKIVWPPFGIVCTIRNCVLTAERSSNQKVSIFLIYMFCS